MNLDERVVLQQSLKKTQDLFERRNRSEDWAENLIEGSKNLTTKAQWKHYYVWLANPHKYNEDAVDGMEIDNSLKKIDEYPEHMEVETFQNGPCETLIHVKNPQFHTNMEEEKMDV